MYIEQAFKFKHEWWRYTIIPILFFGLMGMQFFIVSYLDINVNEFLKEEIAAKGSNRVFFENLFPFLILILGLFMYVKFVHNQSIVSLTTSRKTIDFNRFLLSFSLIIFFTVSTTLISYFTSPENFELQFNFFPFLYLFIITIILIPFQAGFEEYLFRGYLMQGLGVITKNKWVPLLVTSFIFGGLHYLNPEVEKLGDIAMVYYIGTGLFLGVITLMDEGMELALGFHIGNNLIISLLVTSDWGAFQTNSIFLDKSEPASGLEIIMPIFILYPILVLIFAKKYKWTNWKDKLFGKVIAPQETISAEVNPFE